MGTDTIRALQIGKSWLPELAGGGLDRMFYGLVKNLPAEGVEVFGLVAGSPGVVKSSGGTVLGYETEDASLMARWTAGRRATRKALSEFSPDLAAIHFALYGFPARSHLAKVPRVIHFHGPWALESRAEGASSLNVRFKQLVEASVYKDAERYIVLSEAFSKVLRENYGVPHDRIRLVPGGVEIDRFDTDTSGREARERLGWPEDRPIVFSVRRLAHRMGLDNLIHAIKQVRKSVPDVLLLIAGKGPIENELNDLIAQLDCRDSVRLLGFVSEEDLALAYSASDLTVVPTVSLEGFGLITLESLASGTPVIVTPIGGLPEVVTDLDEALVTEDSSQEALTDRISNVLLGRVKLPDTAACKAYARSKFAWPEIARQTASVYREVLS